MDLKELTIDSPHRDGANHGTIDAYYTKLEKGKLILMKLLRRRGLMRYLDTSKLKSAMIDAAILRAGDTMQEDNAPVVIAPAAFFS